MKSLSVIIPVYNCASFLRACAESITAVNAYCESPFVREIVLVDDGSTDRSSALCDELAAGADPDVCAIHVIHQKNSGVSAARNAGLQAATGDYILFVDSDDTLDSKLLAELASVIDEEDAPDMVVFGMSFDYFNDAKIYRQDLLQPPILGTYERKDWETHFYKLFEKNALSPIWNKLICRSLLSEHSLFLREDMFLYEDLEFSLRVMERCDKIYFADQTIYHYRQSEDEGNAGRRLKRIAHLTDLVNQIGEALHPFADTDAILLTLYQVLAREKISVSAKPEIDVICGDYHAWIDSHGFSEEIRGNEYASMLYGGQSTKLLNLRRKNRVRHAVANFVKKNIGDFRKWHVIF